MTNGTDARPGWSSLCTALRAGGARRIPQSQRKIIAPGGSQSATCGSRSKAIFGQCRRNDKIVISNPMTAGPNTVQPGELDSLIEDALAASRANDSVSFIELLTQASIAAPGSACRIFLSGRSMRPQGKSKTPNWLSPTRCYSPRTDDCAISSDCFNSAAGARHWRS